MLRLGLSAKAANKPLRVVALGAHADDVEIGAGGTLLYLTEITQVEALVVVFSTDDRRAAEAETSARHFLAGGLVTVQTHDVPDGRIPAHWNRVKDILEACARWDPDLVLCPSRVDAHQDHRTIGDLVPTVFRNHLALEYEIPKWDGDLGQPTVYIPVSDEHMQRKIDLLWQHFPSQRGHDWFDAEVFRGLARIRGMESRSRYAEAFYCRKAVLSTAALSANDR
jgi:LmbE family N-acetylglucosaminyl deacetylase